MASQDRRDDIVHVDAVSQTARFWRLLPSIHGVAELLIARKQPRYNQQRLESHNGAESLDVINHVVYRAVIGCLTNLPLTVMQHRDRA